MAWTTYIYAVCSNFQFPYYRRIEVNYAVYLQQINNILCLNTNGDFIIKKNPINLIHGARTTYYYAYIDTNGSICCNKYIVSTNDTSMPTRVE